MNKCLRCIAYKLNQCLMGSNEETEAQRVRGKLMIETKLKRLKLPHNSRDPRHLLGIYYVPGRVLTSVYV